MLTIVVVILNNKYFIMKFLQCLQYLLMTMPWKWPFLSRGSGCTCHKDAHPVLGKESTQRTPVLTRMLTNVAYFWLSTGAPTYSICFYLHLLPLLFPLTLLLLWDLSFYCLLILTSTESRWPLNCFSGFSDVWEYTCQQENPPAAQHDYKYRPGKWGEMR